MKQKPVGGKEAGAQALYLIDQCTMPGTRVQAKAVMRMESCRQGKRLYLSYSCPFPAALL